jgi:hypothetical protein
MNPSTVAAHQPKLETLSYPGIAKRFVELVVGSVRRDALGIIRSSGLAELDKSSATPSVVFSHCNGKVRFAFRNEIEAIYIDTPRGSLHLSGSCDMSQRLVRFAVRALTVHHAKAMNACISDVMAALTGGDLSRALSSSYARSDFNTHDRNGGFNVGFMESGSISTLHGVLSLSSQKRTSRIGGELGETMDRARSQAVFARRETETFMNPRPHGLSPVYSRPPEFEWPLPPSSFSDFDCASASFSNTHLDSMLTLFCASRTSDVSALDRTMIRKVLAWTKMMKDSRRTSIEQSTKVVDDG